MSAEPAARGAIRLRLAGGEVFVARGAILLDAALAAGLALPFGCRSARCGVCRVEVLDGGGGLEPPGPAEVLTLRAFGCPSEVRLACQARLAGPATVRPVARSDPN